MQRVVALLGVLCAWASAMGEEIRTFDAAAAFGARTLMLRKSEAFLRQGFGM